MKTRGKIEVSGRNNRSMVFCDFLSIFTPAVNIQVRFLFRVKYSISQQLNMIFQVDGFLKMLNILINNVKLD